MAKRAKTVLLALNSCCSSCAKKITNCKTLFLNFDMLTQLWVKYERLIDVKFFTAVVQIVA